MDIEKRKGELTQIVEALNRVADSDDWRKLKGLLWDGIVQSLERQLLYETDKKEINFSEVYRIQGQITWARKFADLEKLSSTYRLELQNLKNYEPNTRDGAL